jgi:hypothetical protein
MDLSVNFDTLQAECLNRRAFFLYWQFDYLKMMTTHGLRAKNR